jgi:hypothetical protein
MKITFEDRFYNATEIKRIFCIKDKTWRVWLYGDSSRKKINKVDLNEMGVFKLPGTKTTTLLIRINFEIGIFIE